MSGTLAPEVLVLGGSGRVGSGVVAALLEAGSPVLAVGRDQQKLEALAEAHADEPGLEILAGSVADDRSAARLAEAIVRRPRPLRAVVDAIAGPRRSARLLDRPVATLRRSLDQDLLPHLAAARHLLPVLQAQARVGRYLLVGGPNARCGWAGYGHASVAGAATRMLAQVLHEEAPALGVRLQMLSIDAPVWTAENAPRACAGWPSVLGVGRAAVSLLAREGKAGDGGVCVVPYGPGDASPPLRMLAWDYGDALRDACGRDPAGHDAGQAA
ncbi:aklaviketone reductase [Pseudoxanthomonas jiangsuensis]|uniref:SDR family NAD(P)-dependent oxidoreductase n=1 Tax=Pseudoxanthomonas jiangsuensis TaxID=619688 RepID=UPI001391716A|nr:SDR family NAD(P)-dependent oxidoreductase [Pseudoxanthomonas jiangsuensis]KAF1696707.1 aklaviketone reductase [Pseudoxanthomonas jiangsuensis]